jgi:hypothetical protein
LGAAGGWNKQILGGQPPPRGGAPSYLRAMRPATFGGWRSIQLSYGCISHSPSPTDLRRSTDSDTFNRASPSKRSTRRAGARCVSPLSPAVLRELLTRCLRDGFFSSSSLVRDPQPTETYCLFPASSKPNPLDISFRRATLRSAALQAHRSRRRRAGGAVGSPPDPVPDPSRRSLRMNTAMLPNCPVRACTGRDTSSARTANYLTVQHVSGRNKTRRDGRVNGCQGLRIDGAIVGGREPGSRG